MRFDINPYLILILAYILIFRVQKTTILSNRFYSNEHLKSRKLLAEIFKIKQSVASFPLRLLWLELPNTSDLGKYRFQEQSADVHNQIAFSVPKRKLKHAVDRNRVKRQLREIYRLNKAELLPFLHQEGKKIVTILVYNEGQLHDSNYLEKKYQYLIYKLKQKLSPPIINTDNTAENTPIL